MKLIVLFLTLVSTIAAASSQTEIIAFGSRLDQPTDQPMWHSIAATDPDAFVFLGDNLHTDTTDEDAMRAAYAARASQDGYQALKAISPVYATWDDDDYGERHADTDHPARELSEQVFLDFFEAPVTAPERSRPGIYSSRYLDDDVQLILLDTRYFRTPLKTAALNARCRHTNYVPNKAVDATLLGGAQWQWLARQLRKPARVRIIGSSIQVIPQEHCVEKWSNFPRERERLFRLIGDTGAEGVIFISGGRNLGEISKIEVPEVDYPLYEVTSSGLIQSGFDGENNAFRLTEDNLRQDNFGVIEIDRKVYPPVIELQLRDAEGRIRLFHEIGLETISAISP